MGKKLDAMKLLEKERKVTKDGAKPRGVTAN